MKTDETVINCSTLLGDKKVEWETYITYINFYRGYYEAVIENYESEFTIIVGATQSYNFVAIPNKMLSSFISRYDDIFWNSDHLGEMLGIIDATSIATAIAYIDKNKEKLKK